MEYNKLNNILGWSTFLVAAWTFLSTIEPTVSWWDCGEYIATAYKLEVGHPPGGPFFQMLGRLVTLFTPKEQAALMINDTDLKKLQDLENNREITKRSGFNSQVYLLFRQLIILFIGIPITVFHLLFTFFNKYIIFFRYHRIF